MSTDGHHLAAEQQLVLASAATRSGEAVKHERAAAKHAAFAAELALHVTEACAGLEPALAEAEQHPLVGYGTIVAYEPVFASEDVGDGAWVDPRAGVAIYVRPRSGVTKEWFQQVVDCSIAKAAAQGFDDSGETMDPFYVRDLDAKVLSSTSTLQVLLTSETPRSIVDVRRRTEAFIATHRGQ